MVSPYSNPCPVLHKNGTMSLFYEGLSDLPPPKCSNESIGVQHCRNRTGGCDGGSVPCRGHETCPRGSAIFNHSAEDPSIFQTVIPRLPAPLLSLPCAFFCLACVDETMFAQRRGWHMLVNALPGGCHPQEAQGGHA